jgi:CheY-like chemotaxis protein
MNYAIRSPKNILSADLLMNMLEDIAADAPRPVAPKTMQTLRVLLVEPSPYNFETNGELAHCHHHGIELERSGSLSEAIGMLNQTHYDAILLDMTCLELQAVELIKREATLTPLIAMVGLHDDQSVISGAGADRCLAKIFMTIQSLRRTCDDVQQTRRRDQA